VVQTQDLILHLQAGGTEQVVDVIRGREADGEVVRDIAITQLFVLDQGFGKIQGELIAGRADRQQGVIVF